MREEDSLRERELEDGRRMEGVGKEETLEIFTQRRAAVDDCLLFSRTAALNRETVVQPPPRAFERTREKGSQRERKSEEGGRGEGGNGEGRKRQGY